jgi:hypothetical protein
VKLTDFLKQKRPKQSPCGSRLLGDDITLDGLKPLLAEIQSTGFHFRDETYLDSWIVIDEAIYETDDVSVWSIECNGSVIALLSTDIQETCIHVDLRGPQLWWDKKSTLAIVDWLVEHGVATTAHEYTEALQG